ncbi:hypothetical protein CARUB_v10020968mg [Capsella rubella]|uniref:Uncharacterized protein n=1 Tax=Capsella rubella TaxID=81985 RepID=R0I0L9_9BRAS|nr:uncharacterized protein LOC17895005 isoform X1 [Capsella rubella]EOA35734.1 hypothetical protein CARUB_v10020968mg [Capsella rubella]
MRRFLQRCPSLLARSFLHSPVNLNTNARLAVVPLFDRAVSGSVFFSSESDSDSARGVNSDEVVSKEELKTRIRRFLDDGDEDTIPELFELMMIRKLSGEHDDSDDEVMEEVRKYPVNYADDTHSESDTESDASGDSDFEIDGPRDGDSSDSDIEFDGLKDIGLSDVNIKIDGLKDIGLSDVDIKIDGLKANPSSYSDTSESD